MVACVLRTAPALSLAVLLCACCLFAGDPPMPYGGYMSVAFFQNPPAVVETTGRKHATTTGSRRQVSALPSCRGDQDCVRMLRALINDPEHGWLTEPQSAAEYANGARFFAYRALRQTLSCRELILATQDLTTAAARLGAPDTGVSAARTASALSLSKAVTTELRNEITDRC